MKKIGMKSSYDAGGDVLIWVFLLLSILVIPAANQNYWKISSVIIIYISIFICFEWMCAIRRLLCKEYISTTFFILDMIPVINLIFRIFEKFCYIYCGIRKLFRSIVKAYIETNDGELNNKLKLIEEHDKRMNKKIKKLKLNSIDEEQKEIVEKIYEHHKELEQILEM